MFLATVSFRNYVTEAAYSVLFSPFWARYLGSWADNGHVPRGTLLRFGSADKIFVTIELVTSRSVKPSCVVLDLNSSTSEEFCVHRL